MNFTRPNKLSFPFWVAKRYLFSKKSHNAINWISGDFSRRCCHRTLALVCVLSVFNGFESLIQGMFSNFDPDLKISLAREKRFKQIRKLLIKSGKAIDSCFAEIVEENALLRFREKQMPATIKGVSDDFNQITKIDSIMYDGDFELHAPEKLTGRCSASE